MIKKVSTYSYPPEFSLQNFLNQLNELYSFNLVPQQNATLIFYDTFDWRLFSGSFVLFTIEKQLFIRKLFRNTILDNCRYWKKISYSSELPKSKLKNTLTRIIGARALFHVAQVDEKEATINLFNNEQKATAIIKLFDYKSDSDAFGQYSFLQLESITDYANTFNELDNWLISKGFIGQKKADVFFQFFSKTERSPGDYSSKFKIKLLPEMPAGKALIEIILYLLTIIKTNREYILKNIDPEFLHDFRVACRRIKSLLGNQNALNTELTSELREEITSYLKTTNELRDLDVYLLNTNYYKSILPKDFRNKINFLFTYLKRRRNIIIKNLEKDSFVEKIGVFLNKWESILTQNSEKIIITTLPVLEIKQMASREILSNYKQIIKMGNLILKTKNTHKLHSLRIKVKNLRYLMDTYKSLYSTKKIEILINQLKTLQNNLGDFNDLYVQGRYLINISNRLSTKAKYSHDTLIAVGSLIGLLHQAKVKTENEFYAVFKDFSKNPNKTVFTELFSGIQIK